MKVSVSITTYNHEKYILHAIESALMQQTSFDFEIVIGEDDSSDNTREIVKEYKEKYPDKITLFLNDRKNVIFINGQPTGRWNFINNLKHTRGKYIALLEGDDYWTDPHKLQKQVDFLDSHPDCTICFHNVTVIYDDRPDSSHPFHVRNPGRPFTQKKPKPTSTLRDIIKRNFIQTPSVMFRARLFEEFPEWFLKTPLGDWSLHILNAHYGDIGYIDEVMGVYRVHKGGVWSLRGEKEIMSASISAAELIKRNLCYEYRKILEEQITGSYLKLARRIHNEERKEQPHNDPDCSVPRLGVSVLFI